MFFYVKEKWIEYIYSIHIYMYICMYICMYVYVCVYLLELNVHTIQNLPNKMLESDAHDIMNKIVIYSDSTFDCTLWTVCIHLCSPLHCWAWHRFIQTELSKQGTLSQTVLWAPSLIVNEWVCISVVWKLNGQRCNVALFFSNMQFMAVLSQYCSDAIFLSSGWNLPGKQLPLV